MLVNIIVILIGLSGGVVAGGALSAFITLIKLIPQMVQITKTRGSIKLYERVFALGAIIFSILYFSNFNLRLFKVIVIAIGFFMGMFIGLFSSAIAEVLDVIPILTRKIKMRKEISYIIYALLFGRLAGSIYYLIYY